MPKHYQKGKIEPIHLILAQKLNFTEGSIIKYICRYKHKHPTHSQQLEDLTKARTYLNLLIREFKKNERNQKSVPK